MKNQLAQRIIRGNQSAKENPEIGKIFPNRESDFSHHDYFRVSNEYFQSSDENFSLAQFSQSNISPFRPRFLFNAILYSMKTLLLLSSEQKSNSTTTVGKTQRLIPSFASNASKSRMMFKSLMLTLILFVVGSGSVWGQTFSIVGTGTGANTTTSYPAPFGNYYWGAKNQFYITAAQLTAAGIPANASISSIGFDVVADNGTTVHTGFQVTVFATATANPISAGYVTAGQVGQTASVNYNPVTGWNQINFAAPFIWNGTSNLVVQTCFNNSAFGTNATTRWTTTGLGTGTWSRWYRADAAGVCGSTLTTGTSTTTRPNMRFGWTVSTACTGTPNAGTAAISSASGCAPLSTTLSATGITSGSGITYQWQSGPSATGPWTNVAGATSTSSTVTAPSGLTYYKLVTTCSSSGLSNSSNAVSFNGTACGSNNIPSTGSNVISCGTSTFLYDAGGSAGDYAVNSSGYTVLANSGSGVITLSGTSSGESCCDYIRVYRGVGTAGTLVGTYYMGTAIPTITSLAGESLTVQLYSDGSVQGAGCTIQVLYSGTCAPPCVPTGDQTSYGAGSWIGYVYDAATAGAFTTYKGIVTEATTFNRTHTTIAAGATAPHCSMNSDLFTIRYKNTTNFPAGYYTFSVGGDDGVRFSIDGGATWLINNWVIQGYTVSSNPTQVYLSGNTNMVFEYFENSGGAQSSFSYAFTPACSGTPTPGNTLASATSVTSGSTTNLSLQNATAPATYQWQSSTSSTGPWTSIGGATAATYTATVTATTWYQCIVTCTASGATATSAPVQVVLTYCIPTGNASYYITNVTTTGGITNIANPTASNGGYGNFTAQSASNSVGTGTSISVAHTATGGGAGVGIWIDWNNDLDFADANEQIAITTGWNYSPFGATINIPAGTPVGNYRMRVVIDYNAIAPSSCPVGISGETEDYTFAVATPPACSVPSALTSSAVTATSATISWTAPASAPASGYNYYVSTSSTAPTAGTTPTGTTAAGVTTVNLSGLTANTTYYFWVSSNCGGASGVSAWAGASSFYTGPCVPTGTAAYYITNVTTTGGTANIANATGANGGYGNFMAQSASNSIGTGTNFSVAHTATGGGAGVGVWINWNNDMDFADANEQIAITTGWNYSPFTGTINIPAGTPAGNYQMRVVIDYNAIAPSSCPVAIAGESEDYTFTVIALPPCAGTPNPGATTATSSQVFAGGSTTLGITTAQNGTGISYQWQSGASASGPWTTIGGATSATYVASPTAATYYQCIVTCSAGPASATSTPIFISFNAYCNPDYTGYTGTTPQNGSEGTVDGDMITNVTITGTTLNNTSTSALSSPQYTFYSGITGINMYPSNSYNVNVTAGAFTNQNFAVWIDYNDDNDFYDAGELIGYSAAATTAAYQTVSFTINLACAPPYGTHRMRVRDAYATAGSTMDPCTTYGWGETEDYLVTIVPGTPFAPAFTATPTTPNCVGAQVTYTATAGQTNYAWTFPGTAGVDYTLVSGGTSASNTAVVTYNNGGSKTITMNYASPLGCASSGAINNTITLGAGTLATTAATGDVIWRGATSVNWQTASNWYYYDGTTYTVAGSTPTTTTRTIIPNNTCVTQQPSVAAGTTVNAKDVVIETGATLTMTTGTLNVNGNFTNNGTFVAGTCKVVFNAAGTVSGNATTFNDVDVNNGVNFGSALSTVNGIMSLNNGGWVNTNPPTYGTSSVLKYNTGGTYGRYLEWSATSGPGYPNDVQVSNNTVINYPNTGGAFSTNLAVRRNLTIDAGSNLYMDYGTGNASGSLTVGGNVTAAGDLSLGNQIGGDIYVGGNWTRTTGNLYANNRAVFFNGATGNQTITKTGGESFPYMVVNKASGNVILANNVTVSGGLTLTSGLVEVGTNNFEMGSASVTGGSATSYVKTASTGVMSRSVGSSAITFPVGNSTYNPAMVTNAGTSDVFSLRVVDNVTADGTGVGATTTDAVVKRTWMVNESTSGGSNVTLRLYWNGTGEEINSFSPASAFIAHYISWTNMWDNIGFTGQGTGYFETNNITSFSPFTISSSTTFAPLPIELVSFQANCKENNAVAVTWTTASEHNTSYYIVEKSRDGQSWSVLGEMAAAGNSTQLLNYEMIDADKATGTTYYRLTQYDNDGVFEVFNAVSVNCEGAAPSTSIMTYPNPSDNSFYVSMYTTGMKGNGQLTITDTRGTVVYAQSVNIQDGNNVFHVGDLNAAPGMYYIQVSNETTTTDIVKHSLR